MIEQTLSPGTSPESGCRCTPEEPHSAFVVVVHGDVRGRDDGLPGHTCGWAAAGATSAAQLEIQACRPDSRPRRRSPQSAVNSRSAPFAFSQSDSSCSRGTAPSGSGVARSISCSLLSSGRDLSSQGPRYAGKLTRELVYKQLPQGVLEELERLNPNVAKGRRQFHHHRFLSGEIGNGHLEKHVAVVISLMRISSWEEFERFFNKNFGKQIEMEV